MKTTDVRYPVKDSSPAASTDIRASIIARGKAVLDAEAEAIQEARGRLGPPFVGAVEAILECRGRVCVTGIGKAGLIGKKIQATLASTGTLAYGLHPVEALHGDLGMVHGDDVVIALSKSGGSELVELLPRFTGMGCIVILLTARMESPAASHANFVLDIGSRDEACPLGLAPSSSTTAMLAVGDALALTVMELKEVRPEQYARYHPGGALGRYLMKAHQIMRTGADCPRVRDSASVRECHEAILKAPLRAGAAAILDAQDKLVGIMTHGDFFRLFTSRVGNQQAGFCQAHQARGSDALVSEVMTAHPKCIGSEERVVDALQLMRTHSIDELPVVGADGRFVGLIDIQDLIARGFSVFDTA